MKAGRRQLLSLRDPHFSLRCKIQARSCLMLSPQTILSLSASANSEFRMISNYSCCNRSRMSWGVELLVEDAVRIHIVKSPGRAFAGAVSATAGADIRDQRGLELITWTQNDVNTQKEY